MNVKVEKQPKSTLKLSVTVEVAKVKEAYEKILSDLVASTELPGFRKGMAPKEMVKEKADPSKLYGEVINSLLQTYYTQAVKENHIAPISNPRVEIKEFDLEKDFEFSALVATRPDVKIGDFRKKLKEAQEKKEKETHEANAKKLAAGEQIDTEAHTHLTTNDVLDAINDASEVEVPDLIVEEEAERMMARLVDQAQSIGLSLDQYLKAQNKTSEQLTSDYKKTAEKSVKAELVLGEIIKTEKVDVTEVEIEEIVKASGDPNALEQLKDPLQKWYIKSILEKNKLINKLIEEVAHGEPKKEDTK